MKALRKILAICLLAVFSLPFLSPLMAFSAKTDASVPACCRRSGKHHCMIGAAERSSLARYAAPTFNAPSEKCPYLPASIAVVHGDAFVLPTKQAVYAELIAHPAVVEQTESRLRISRGRSRQKRGPPASSSL